MRLAPGGPPIPMLHGSTISSAYEMESQTGNTGIYFVFPDIGIAYPGRFRLKCVLLTIPL